MLLCDLAGHVHEGAVGEGHADVLGLGAADELAVQAGRVVPVLAVGAGVVGGEEGADHQLAGLDDGHIAADLFDDAEVLVAARGGFGDVVDTAVVP